MKRSMLLVLTLVLLLVLAPFTLAAGTGETENPGDHARFYMNGTSYSIFQDESGQQHVTSEASEGDAELPDGVSYDLEANTLTLNGAQLDVLDIFYEVTDETGNVVDYWLPSPALTIVLEGESTINASSNHGMFIANGVNATVTGDANSALTLSVPASDGARAIRVEQNCTLTIAGETSVTATITGSVASEGYVEVIAMGVYHSDLTVQDKATLTATAEQVENNYSFDVVSGTMTVAGNATVNANSTLVVGVDDAAFILDGQAQVVIDDMDEGLLFNGADVTISGGTLDIQVTKNPFSEDYASSGIVCNEGSLTLEDGSVSVSAYNNGISLNSAAMTVSGGDLDIDLTAPVDYNTDYDDDGNPYYSDYAWTDGIACNGSTLSISGGNVTIDFPNGNGISLNNVWDETETALGTSAMTQSGGTLTVTSNGQAVESIAISVASTMNSNMHNTALFTGGATKLQARLGLSVDRDAAVTLKDKADIQVQTIANPYNWGTNLISGTLNVYGGAFAVNSVNSNALTLNEESVYNQTGGAVTLTVTEPDFENNPAWSHGIEQETAGSSITISGGTLDISSDSYIGMECDGSFTLLGGTVTCYGGNRSILLADTCKCLLAGGSLKASTSETSGAAALQLLYNQQRHELTITGGNHSFLAPAGKGLDTVGLWAIAGLVSFEGGTVRATGDTAIEHYAELNWHPNPEVNQIHLADGMHAVSNVTGNELQFVYQQDSYVYDDVEYFVHRFHYTEDSTEDGKLCTDVTISSEEGEIPVDYTGSMEITSGQAIVGAPVVIKYTVVTHGKISLDLPDELRLIQDSLSVNGEPVSDLEDIEISGSAIIRFSVKPLKTGTYTVTSTVSTPFETYTTSMPVTASGFQATAPSMTKVPTVDVTGHGTPGDIITLEIRGQKGGIATVTGTVSSIGTFDIPVTLPIADMTQEESFTIEVYFTSPYSRSSGQLGATLTVVYRPDCIVLNNFYITNIVHNNKNERVPVTFGVDYLNNRVTQSFYTYWPDEPVFSFTVELDIPQNWTVNSVFIRIKLLNNTFIDVPLQMDGSPSLWEGELELEDPSNPPVEFQVFWNAHPTEIVQELQINAGSHSFLPIMDPSGTVYSGTLDNPVPGATVTLYFGGNGKTADAANAYVFDMTNYGQVNPQVSDALGNYAWNVPEGWWQIVATYEQDGRTYTAKSEWLHVLPIQEGVGLNLNLPTVDPDEPDTPHKPSGGTSATTPSQPTQTFRDVSKRSYYYDAVTWAVENGVTDGTGSNTFSPDKACTRAEIVTFLWRAAGKPAAKSSVNPFTDVSKSAYYYDAVLWAVEAGITQGTSATTFSPDKTCSRAEAVTFLFRAASGKASSGTVPFTDVPANAYYKDAVLWAVAENVTQGTGSSTFSPDKTCSRAEIVTFLYRSPLSE